MPCTLKVFIHVHTISYEYLSSPRLPLIHERPLCILVIPCALSCGACLYTWVSHENDTMHSSQPLQQTRRSTRAAAAGQSNESGDWRQIWVLGCLQLCDFRMQFRFGIILCHWQLMFTTCSCRGNSSGYCSVLSYGQLRQLICRCETSSFEKRQRSHAWCFDAVAEVQHSNQ